jgi:hypothetical protein
MVVEILLMPIRDKTERPAARKDSMVNIWVGKQIGPQLDDLAAREQELTGRTTTRIDFAHDLFIWALEIYKSVGSLKDLRRAPVLQYHSLNHNSSVNNVEQRADQVSRLKGEVRGRKGTKKRKSGGDQA